MLKTIGMKKLKTLTRLLNHLRFEKNNNISNDRLGDFIIITSLIYKKKFPDSKIIITL